MPLRIIVTPGNPCPPEVLSRIIRSGVPYALECWWSNGVCCPVCCTSKKVWRAESEGPLCYECQVCWRYCHALLGDDGVTRTSTDDPTLRPRQP